MKILFLSTLLSYGGASKLIFDMMPLLERKGHKCRLLILTDKNSKYIEELREIGISVDVVPSEYSGHWAKIKYIKKYIMTGDYDVIHANLFPMIYYCSIVKRLSGKNFPPIVMTEHSTDNKRRYYSCLRPLEKFIYKKYNHVISISEQAQKRLLSWLKFKNTQKFFVIENGINLQHFQMAMSYKKTELLSGYREGDILIGMIGSFTPQKNHITMINAMIYLPEHYKLLLAGEGPLMDEMKEKVESLGLSNRIIFMGFRRDIAEIMHTVDVVAIPSIWEGFGLIAAEAMACNTLIVASDVPGLSEIVGDCGLKFVPQNSEALAKAITCIEDRQLASEYIRRGRARVEQYDIKRLISEYVEVYNSLCEVRNE